MTAQFLRPLAGIGLLLCSASVTAAREGPRTLWKYRAEQLCCLTDGPHWRLVDKRRCYTDRWRAKSELRWCLQGDRRTKPTRAELVRQLELEHFPPVPDRPDPAPTPTEDPWHNVPPPPAVGPTSTLRALDRVRTITTLRTQRAANLEPPLPDPTPDLRETSTPPGAPRFTQPPLVPSGQPPTPPAHDQHPPPAPGWPWLALVLAALMLGTAATEDID